MRRTRKHESSDARLRGGLTSSSCEGVVTTLEQRGQPRELPSAGSIASGDSQRRWKAKTVGYTNDLRPFCAGSSARTI